MAAYEQFAAIYDRLMYDCDYDSWSQYLLEGLRARGIVTGRGIDFACGSGKVTKKLAAAGFTVIGVDSSAAMLSRAAVNCLREKQRILFAQADMTDFSAGKPQDFITCVCDGVNYLAGNELERFAANCAQNLRSGGVLAFDIGSDYKLSQILGNNLFGDDTEDATYLWQNHLHPEYVDLDLIFFVREKGVYYKFTEQHRMYRHAVTRLKEVLKQAGFGKIEVYGWMTAEEPGKSCERIQFFAVKE